MRKIVQLLIPAVIALGLTVVGLIAANSAANDSTAHPAFGAPLDSPSHTAATDGEPWRI